MACTVSGSKLLADSKSVHVLCALRSRLAVRSKKVNNAEIFKFFQFFSQDYL
jgi:hypothetical protein